MRKTYEKPRVEMENFTTDEFASCYAIVDMMDDHSYVVRSGVWNCEFASYDADAGETGIDREKAPDDGPDTVETWWNRSHNAILCTRPVSEEDHNIKRLR